MLLFGRPGKEIPFQFFSLWQRYWRMFIARTGSVTLHKEGRSPRKLWQMVTKLKRVWDLSDLALVVFMFGTLLVLIVLVHQIVMDMLLGVSLALAMLILLGDPVPQNPSDFSGFPTLLLIFTLYRLGLNVGTTRLILSEADAGDLIDAFGEFVVSGNFVVGIVIFLILTVINFTVITKGAGRIAEVAARFTLDAMPGKQLSIDAELDKGYITVDEAIEKRRLLQQEADFYGAMWMAPASSSGVLPSRPFWLRWLTSSAVWRLASSKNGWVSLMHWKLTPA